MRWGIVASSPFRLHMLLTASTVQLHAPVEPFVICQIESRRVEG